MVPRLWRLTLPIDEGPPPITLAQVVPVSEAEYQAWRSDVAGFEAELAHRDVDVLISGARDSSRCGFTRELALHLARGLCQASASRS